MKKFYVMHTTKAGGNHCAMFPLFKIEGAPHDQQPDTPPPPCLCSLCVARAKVAT